MNEKLADYLSFVILDNFEEVDALNDDGYYHGLISSITDYFSQYDIDEILAGDFDGEIIKFVHDKFASDELLKSETSSNIDDQIEIFKKESAIPIIKVESSREEAIQELIRLRDSIVVTNQLKNNIPNYNIDEKKEAVFRYIEEIAKKNKLALDRGKINIIMNIYVHAESYDDVLAGKKDDYLEYVVIFFSDEFRDVKSQALDIVRSDMRYNSRFFEKETSAMSDISCMLVKKGHKTIAEDDMDEIDDIIDFYFGKLSSEKQAAKRAFKRDYDEMIKKIKSITPESAAKTIGIGIVGAMGIMMAPYIIVPGAYYLYKKIYEKDNPGNSRK